MHMSKKFSCLPRNWIYLLQNYFSSYVYLKDIYKTLKGIGKIQFLSELIILLNLWISKFYKNLQKEDNSICQNLNNTPYVWNFSVIHPTHITVYTFWRTMFCSNVLLIIEESYILTVKNNDDWTFWIFVILTIMFPLELGTRLYYLSITIMTDTSPPQKGCSRTRKRVCSKGRFINF